MNAPQMHDRYMGTAFHPGGTTLNLEFEVSGDGNSGLIPAPADIAEALAEYLSGCGFTQVQFWGTATHTVPVYPLPEAPPEDPEEDD